MSDMQKQKAVIDGSNIAYLEAPKQPRANIKNIFAVIRAVEERGLDPIVIVDPTIGSIVADTHELERLLAEPYVESVPEGSDAAALVLKRASENDAVIVSNSTYIDYFEEYPWIEQRRTAVAVVDGTVHLLDYRLRKAS